MLPDVAARYVRFVFSAEPVARLATLGERLARTSLGVEPNAVLPAEHRALPRAARHARAQLESHWGRLARRLDEPTCSHEGAAPAGELLAELESRVGDDHDLHGQPSAQAVGARLAGARGVSDLLLERNQAFRTALLDLQHVTTLLGYLAALARTRGDAALAAWHEGWERALAGARGARTGRGGRAGGRSGGRDRSRRREPRGPRGRSRSVSHSGPWARRSTIRRSVALARRRAT